MDEAFVENAEHDVDHQDGHDQQQRQPLGGGLKSLGGSLEAGGDGGREVPGTAFSMAATASPSGTPGLQVEGDGHRR